jgi:hypothetical protein
MEKRGDFTRADLEDYLARALPELERTSDPFRIAHTVQVTSFGGSGTTALCKHLLDAGVDLQPGPAQWPFKHRRQPPSADEVRQGFRVIYLLGDPRDAVLSIFRRDYQIGHYRSLNGTEPDEDAKRRLATLESFLSAGVDDFALSDHVQGWLDHPDGYPVLFVRYEALADVWADVMAFVGLPAEHPPLPAKARKSDRRSMTVPLREQLDALYGDLAARIELLSPMHLVPGRTRLS